MAGLKDLLENRQCFKMVCAANNFDAAAVENLVRLYYAAGCRFFDVSADAGVLSAAKKAAPDAHFCVSIAAEGDPHCRPAEFDKVLPPLIEIGVDCLELHAATTSDIEHRWTWLRANFDGMLSLCVSRSKLSDAQMLVRVRACNPDIIQAA